VKRILTYFFLLIFGWIGLSAGLHSATPVFKAGNTRSIEQVVLQKTVLQNDCLFTFNQLPFCTVDDDSEQEDEEEHAGASRKWLSQAVLYSIPAFTAGNTFPGLCNAACYRFPVRYPSADRLAYLCIFRI